MEDLVAGSESVVARVHVVLLLARELAKLVEGVHKRALNVAITWPIQIELLRTLAIRSGAIKELCPVIRTVAKWRDKWRQLGKRVLLNERRHIVFCCCYCVRVRDNRLLLLRRRLDVACLFDNRLLVHNRRRLLVNWLLLINNWLWLLVALLHNWLLLVNNWLWLLVALLHNWLLLVGNWLLLNNRRLVADHCRRLLLLVNDWLLLLIALHSWLLLLVDWRRVFYWPLNVNWCRRCVVDNWRLVDNLYWRRLVDNLSWRRQAITRLLVLAVALLLRRVANLNRNCRLFENYRLLRNSVVRNWHWLVWNRRIILGLRVVRLRRRRQISWLLWI